MDPWVLLAFVPVALALNLTPGADMLFCLAQGLRGGARPAWAASLGISTGAMVHVTLAGLGLGALVAASPWVFGVLRWVGVAYLLWLAVHTLRTPLAPGDQTPPVRPARAFRDGMLVNLSNPKVILFILAFLPQFVDPARAILPQFLMMGAVIALGGGIVNGLVGQFAGTLGRALVRSRRMDAVLRGLCASIFGALALRLAWEARA